jgi:hypothetical protein
MWICSKATSDPRIESALKPDLNEGVEMVWTWFNSLTRVSHPNIIIKNIFLRPERLSQTWNNGILEGWFLKGYYPF